MASSIDNDQSSTAEKFGSIARDEIQKVCNDDTKSSEPIEYRSSTTSNDTFIDHILLSGDIDNVNGTTVDKIDTTAQLCRAIHTYCKNFDVAEQRLFSIYNHMYTSTTSRPNDILGDSNIHPVSQFIPSTGEQQSHEQVVTKDVIPTIDNLQTHTTNERHIMISYNDLSSDICQKMCHRLQNLGYKVWMDEYDLHGRIFEGMAQAIQNSYIVLLCYNEKYAKSGYCLQEAAYAFEKHIDLIPCRLEDSYQPDGWLGILISDRLYIDFSSSSDFDDSFKKLVNEIEYFKARPQTHSKRTAILQSNANDRNIQMNNQIMREQFNNIIREYKESINKTNQDLHLLEKEELCQLIIYLRERLYKDTLPTPNNEQRNSNHDKIIRDLLEQSQTQTELLKNITKILSTLVDCKMIIKLSLIFIFVWTIKTHIVDAYLKHK